MPEIRDMNTAAQPSLVQPSAARRSSDNMDVVVRGRVRVEMSVWNSG